MRNFNTMKRNLFLLIIALFIAIPSFAQKQSADKEAMRKQFTEFKLKFLADEVGLKDDQRKQFEEVYSQMETERRAIFKRIKKIEKSIKDNKNATKEDYKKANNEKAAAKKEMFLLENKYDEKFATFLSSEQVYKLKEAEEKFTEKMRDCRNKKLSEKKDKKDKK